MVGFVGHTVSITTTQCKSSHIWYINKWAWLCFSIPLLQTQICFFFAGTSVFIVLNLFFNYSLIFHYVERMLQWTLLHKPLFVYLCFSRADMKKWNCCVRVYAHFNFNGHCLIALRMTVLIVDLSSGVWVHFPIPWLHFII